MDELLIAVTTYNVTPWHILSVRKRFGKVPVGRSRKLKVRVTDLLKLGSV